MTSQALNILFISDHLGHEGGRIHGATRYFLDVLPRLYARNDIKLHTAFLRDYHESASLLQNSGVRHSFLERSKHDPRAVMDIVRLIRKNHLHLLHCAGMKGILSGRLAARMTGIPCVAHLHDMLPQCFPIRQLMQITSAWSILTIAISDAVSRFAAEHFRIPAQSITVLRNGIEIEPFQKVPPTEKLLSLRDELGIPRNAPIIISVGRLHAVKGMPDSIEVLRELQDLDAWLLVVGEGPEEKHLRKQAEGLPVIFAGQRMDIPDLLSLATLMLMPSYSEGLGLSAMEALAAGVPVVAYATGGLNEVVAHGQCGQLVPTGDIKILTAATRALLTDSASHEAFSCAARLHAQTFSISQHVSDLVAIYHSVNQLATTPSTKDTR